MSTPSLQRWPILSDAVLRPSIGSRLCLTCRWFHHQAELDAIPVLACRWHRGRLSHAELLSHCCAAWDDDRVAPRAPGTCSEAA